MRLLPLLLLPLSLQAAINSSPLKIEVGEPITVTFTREHQTTPENLTNQIPAPFTLLSSEERADATLLTLTSWQAGSHPLYFAIPSDNGILYSAVERIEVTPPPVQTAIDSKEYLLGFLPLPDQKESLLSSENRALWEERGAEPIERSELGAAISPVATVR